MCLMLIRDVLTYSIAFSLTPSSSPATCGGREREMREGGREGEKGGREGGREREMREGGRERAVLVV